MDPHEDLVAKNNAANDAHKAEVARLASDAPDAGKVEVLPEDQAVLDAKKAVEDAQAALIKAQQDAYMAKIKRADEAAAKAAADAEAETAKEIDEGKPPLTPEPRPALRATPVPQQ